jgi:hypothetical protein
MSIGAFLLTMSRPECISAIRRLYDSGIRCGGGVAAVRSPVWVSVSAHSNLPHNLPGTMGRRSTSCCASSAAAARCYTTQAHSEGPNPPASPPAAVLSHQDWQRPDLHLVLVNPQIPQNTGNAARTCAATAVALHLVGPLGFELDSAKLKRAGLDYW